MLLGDVNARAARVMSTLSSPSLLHLSLSHTLSLYLSISLYLTHTSPSHTTCIPREHPQPPLCTMGAVFAPADIEKLIHHFPPLSVSADDGRPPVVRSLSQNNLKHSAEVLNSFKALVERNDQRILQSSVTTILGIEEGSESIILDQLDSQLYYSADSRYIIPHPLIESIAAVLRDRALRVAVDLHAFTREQDVRRDSLDRLIEEYSGKDWPRVIIDVDATSYLCSHAYSENVRTQVHNATSGAGLEICNLSALLDHAIPPPVVAALATEATSGKGGEVQFSGEQVIYVPPGYNDATAKRSEEQRAAQSAILMERLEHDGFCTLSESADELIDVPTVVPAWDAQIIAEFERKQPHCLRPHSIDVHPGVEATGRGIPPPLCRKLIVRPETLQDELDSMKLAVGTRAGILWRTAPSAATPATIVRSLQQSDFETPHAEELADLLIRSVYAQELEATALSCLSELEGQRHDDFVRVIETRLWSPLHCYAAGVLEVQDTTLKQHLEDFLTIHFKSDAIPSTIAIIRDQGFLHDRTRKRESEKLQKATEEAKAFSDIQKCITKFCHKLKVSPPSESQIFASKSLTVQATCKAMSKLQRGSDVLQNLIWILLATNGPGLFMSSGKDTSRMIKHFEAVCEDAEVAGMLAIWRDKLKQGLADEEDVRQMRELAKAAVEEYGQGEKMMAYAGT